MNPPKINTLKADVEFYLFTKTQPRLVFNFLDELLKELIATYGSEAVEEEIKNQRK